jgi:hypothetical protein
VSGIEDAIVVPGGQAEKSNPSSAPQSMVVTPSTGKIAGLIGTGAHADKNIVFYIIQFCLWAGVALSVVLSAYWMWAKAPDKVPTFADVWHVFGPFITLALGYLFGKKAE